MNDTSFLYPFLDDGETDPHDLLVELRSSAMAKIQESKQLIEESLRENEQVLDEAARETAERVRQGGHVLSFGNGGSACDAIAFADDSARTLSGDPAILTALANDVGTEQIFSRQIEAFGGHTDVAVAFSTSGQSPNLLRAMTVAHQRGLLTIAFAGYSGGALARNDDVDHCIIVKSDSVHRIQEAQAQLSSRLRALVRDQL